MPNYKLSELNAVTDARTTEIMHLQNVSGIDKNILVQDLRSPILNFSNFDVVDADTTLSRAGSYIVDKNAKVTLPSSLRVGEIINIFCKSCGYINQSTAEMVIRYGLSATTKGATASPDNAGVKYLRLAANDYISLVYEGAAEGYSVLSTSVVYGTTKSGGVRTHWSPDGVYLACGFGEVVASSYQVYKRTGDTLALLTVPATTKTTTYQVTWSHSGIYLAIAFGTASPNVEIYKRSGDTLTLLTSLATGYVSTRGLAWSPDDTYLAFSCFVASPNTGWFKRTGDTFNLLSIPASGIASGMYCSWYPTGDYVAFAFTIASILIYRRIGDVLTLHQTLDTGLFAASCIEFSPDGKYMVATSTNTGLNAVVCKLVNNLWVIIKSITPGPTSSRNVCWSPDGTHFIISHNDTYVTLYSVNDDIISLEQNYTVGATAYAGSWCPNGKHIALLGIATTVNLALCKCTTDASNTYTITGNNAAMIRNSERLFN